MSYLYPLERYNPSPYRKSVRPGKDVIEAAKDRKRDYVARVKAMNPEELLEEYTRLAAGDDYDACHTPMGEWEYCYVRRYFRQKLTEAGYFSK